MKSVAVSFVLALLLSLFIAVFVGSGDIQTRTPLVE